MQEILELYFKGQEQISGNVSHPSTFIHPFTLDRTTDTRFYSLMAYDFTRQGQTPWE